MQEDINLALKLYSVCLVLLYGIVCFVFIICVAPTVIATEFDWSLDNPVCQMVIAINNWFK